MAEGESGWSQLSQRVSRREIPGLLSWFSMYAAVLGKKYKGPLGLSGHDNL